MKRAVALALVLLALRGVLAAKLGLAEDEALYWAFGQHLDWGYVDHPPVIALLTRLGTELLGRNELGVRAAGLVLGAGTALLLGHRSDRPALTVALLGVIPLASLGGILATPDVPLCFAWSLGLWAALRERWVVLGVAAGLAFESKYTGALLLPLVIAARPSALRERGPWVAAAVAALLMAPNVLWNAQHDWVSYRFQLRHVATTHRWGDFALAQVGLVTPLLAAAMGSFWLRGPQASGRVLWWTSAPVMLLGLFVGGEANWAAPAVLAPCIALAANDTKLWRITKPGIALGAVACAFVAVHALHPLVRLVHDPLDRLRGGDILGHSVAAWNLPVWTARYQEAALVSFYGGVEASTLPDSGRPNQYDLWPRPMPDHAVFVRPWRASERTAIDALYPRRGPPNDVTAYAPTDAVGAEVPIAHWQVYEVWR